MLSAEALAALIKFCEGSDLRVCVEEREDAGAKQVILVCFLEADPAAMSCAVFLTASPAGFKEFIRFPPASTLNGLPSDVQLALVLRLLFHALAHSPEFAETDLWERCARYVYDEFSQKKHYLPECIEVLYAAFELSTLSQAGAPASSSRASWVRPSKPAATLMRQQTCTPR